MNYTDYEMIEKDLEDKCYAFEWKYEYAWNSLVMTARDVLNRIDCKDTATYETIINGIAYIYNLGVDAEHYNNAMNENVWYDPWDC